MNNKQTALTAEEKQKTWHIVRDLSIKNGWDKSYPSLLYMSQVVYPSMQEYSDQQTSSLIEENKRLQTELETARRDNFMSFLEWFDWQTENTEDPIIVTDVGWFYESDEEGDYPIDRDEIYRVYEYHLAQSNEKEETNG